MIILNKLGEHFFILMIKIYDGMVILNKIIQGSYFYKIELKICE